MKTIKTIFLLALFVSFTNCDNDDDSTNNICDEDYITDTMITGFSNSGSYNLLATMDLEAHEYTIQINADGEICSIGYQNSSTYTGGYTMEIENTNNPSVNYSGVHTFSQSNLDYKTITPVPVSSGDVIIVRRTIQPGYTPFVDEIGNAIIKIGSNMPYPITFNNIVLLGSDAYGGGGPVTDFALPIIGLGFKVN